jgi:hypothetical protein
VGVPHGRVRAGRVRDLRDEGGGVPGTGVNRGKRESCEERPNTINLRGMRATIRDRSRARSLVASMPLWCPRRRRPSPKTRCNGVR